MPEPTILVVDDEQLIRWSLSERLKQEGYAVVEAGTAKEALAAAGPHLDLVLLDFRLPDSDGLRVLKQIKASDPDIPVILLTAFSSIETAVEAMKQGAYHYANKPFNLDELVLVVQKALETTALRREVRALRASQSEPYAFTRIVGESPAMQSLRALLQRAVHDIHEAPQIERLFEDVARAQAARLLEHVRSAMRGHEDDLGVGRDGADPAEQTEVAGIRQLQIEHHERDIVRRIESTQGLSGAPRLDHLVAGGLEALGHGPSDQRFVVDDQNHGHGE